MRVEMSLLGLFTNGNNIYILYIYLYNNELRKLLQGLIHYNILGGKIELQITLQ